MNDRLSIDALYDLVLNYFGARASGPVYDSAELTVGCVLYETFELECGLDNQYGTFGAAIRVGPTLSTTQFFGHHVSMNADVASIRESLELVNRWCRAHLPEAFLAEYENALSWTVTGPSADLSQIRRAHFSSTLRP